MLKTGMFSKTNSLNLKAFYPYDNNWSYFIFIIFSSSLIFFNWFLLSNVIKVIDEIKLEFTIYQFDIDSEKILNFT